jgi:hypothetical protein
MDQKFFVVCDANGECKGVFTDEDIAVQTANYYGAYVSEEGIQDSLPREVSDWLVANGPIIFAEEGE